MKKIIIFLTSVFICSICFAQSNAEIPQKTDFVASTSWVASIAKLAGIEDVISIAPANLKHPPEYEITPDDIFKVVNANFFLVAGYERMMKTIASAAQIDPNKIVTVKTENTFENLEKMATMLSTTAGTQDRANKNLAELKNLFTEAKKRVSESENRNIEVYVNINQEAFSKDIGLKVVSTFGPGPLTSEQIATASEKGYQLVIDNYHNPVSSPIPEVSPQSKVLFFKNFPDNLEDDALINLIRENLEQLWSTGLF